MIIPNLEMARSIASAYAARPEVSAVALAGSAASGYPDPLSDLDFYVFLEDSLDLETRQAIAERFSDAPEVGNDFWGPGDEWQGTDGGPGADVMYWTAAWMDDQLERVLERHEASVGYSTCFWHSARACVPLFDRHGWLAALKGRADVAYPEPLRRAVVAKNHPILRERHSSLLTQVEKAVARGDSVSVNHRVAALLASYFDVLFAANRETHPGEKRLVELTLERCSRRPEGLEQQVKAVLRATANPVSDGLTDGLHRLLDGLDAILRAEELLAPNTRG